ncbi:MAG: diguanylate cyclase, partial [Mariniblastus sp.]|nr:diguanylate cyclase [Mariniblastus sp.]
MDKAVATQNSGDKTYPALSHVVRRYELELKFQRALYQIANLANDPDDIQGFYRQVHRIVAQLTSAKNFFIAILDEEKGRVSFPYYIDDDLTKHPYDFMDLEEVNRLTFVSLILESKQRVHLSHEEMLGLRGQIDPDVGGFPQDWLGIPLIHSGRLFGALVIQSYEAKFRYTKSDEQLMTNIGYCVATALMKRNIEEELVSANSQLKSKNLQLEETTRNLFDSNEELVKSLQVNRETQEKLRFNATHDTLTQLPNRALLLSQLRERINDAQLGGDRDFALLFLDLDRFKVVNDSLGHLAGDKLLVEVANRLRVCIRPSDTVARLGGDEFCILLAQSVTSESIEIVANRILSSLSLPFQLKGQSVVTSTSIGVTVGNLGYETAEDMLRDADTALYDVKANGKAGYKMFDVSMRETAVFRLDLEQALRQSVERNDISVLFQPICELKSKRIVSVEALARWNHREIGSVAPDVFIPIAEEIQIIQQLTECVLEKSGDSIRDLRASNPEQNSLCLNVNFSSYDIQNDDCVEKVKK